MAQDLSTVHGNRALSSLSVALENDDRKYLLYRMCGRRKVKTQSGFFMQHGTEALTKTGAGGGSTKFLANVTSPGAPATIETQTVSQKNYRCNRYSMRSLVTDEEVAQSDDPLSPILDASKTLRSKLLNDMEFLLARVAADYDGYNASHNDQLTTGANGTSWHKSSAAGTGSEPLTNIRDGRMVVEKATGYETNTLVLSAATKYHLDDHNDLSSILQYTQEDYLSGEGIPPYLRGLRIIKGSAVASTAAPGAAHAGDYLFGDHDESTVANQPCAIICYVPPSNSIGIRQFASFIWLDAADVTTGQYGVSMRMYRDEAGRGWWVEVAITLDIKPGSVDGSSLITSAYMISRAAIP